MNIIIPMAGMGKRMRPHTLTTPKPLIPIAGKPIVQRLVEDIALLCKQPIDEIAFVNGRFGEEAEQHLLNVAKAVGAKGRICYQDEALGTAHAIMCAKEQLKGNVIVAFADTLFYANFNLDTKQDGIIWVKQIPDPQQFGVVKINAEGIITDFIEKPKDFISDLAIIGIYYFADGENLRSELQFLLDNNIREKGEFQLTNALENMKKKGKKFKTGEVTEWLDCGNKDATVYTNQRVLEHLNLPAEGRKEKLIAASAKNENSVIIAPCFIGENVSLKNSTVGPYVSIGENTMIENSVITNSIIQTNTKIADRKLDNSMIGNFVTIRKVSDELSVGDYNVM